MEDRARMQWGGKLEYLFTGIGYSVGLGNIWRFPHKFVKNGGGTVLIPYLLTVCLCIFPIIIMEAFLGQFSSSGPVAVWNYCPILKGVGFGIVFNTFVTAIYYAIITMYAFYYMTVSFVSIGDKLPWQSCNDEHSWKTNLCNDKPYPDISKLGDTEKISAMSTLAQSACIAGGSTDNYTAFMIQKQHCFDFRSPEEEYWNRFVLGVHDSTGIDDVGPVVGRNVICLFIIWAFVFYCCLRGIRSIAKVTYVTATFPVLLLLVLLVRGTTLDGNQDGIDFFVQADWSLLGNMSVWSAGATQAIYSIGVGYGSHIVLASYNKFRKNVVRDVSLICLVDIGTSLFAGFIVFAFIGYEAKTLNRPLDKVFADNGPGLMFIAYIRGISQLPESAIWSCLFFLMVFTLGLDSLFVFTWTVYAGIEDLFPRKMFKWKRYVLCALCIVFFLLGLPLVTSGGIHLVVLLDTCVASFSILIFLFAECASVCWIYGYKRFLDDMAMMVGPSSLIFQWYLLFSWVVAAPAFCLFIFIALAIGYERPSYNDVDITGGGEALGWLITLTPMIIMIAAAVVEVRKRGRPNRDNFKELLRSAARPTYNWGPRLEEHRVGRYASEDNYLTAVGNGGSAATDTGLDVNTISVEKQL